MKKTTKDSLGNRMKKYESINRTYIIPKLYTIIRLDGKAFHTYTKGFKRPFDDVLMTAMDETAKYLCSKIQCAKFAYVQSDEITIYLSDMDSYETEMWFNGNIQKMVSVAASMAAARFNKYMVCNKFTPDDIATGNLDFAEFDARVFQVPNEYEVINCLLWRQQDAIRNSIQAVAQSMFSHNELDKKNTKILREMIYEKSGRRWEDMDPKLQRGRFIDKQITVNGVVSKIYDQSGTTYHEPIIDGLIHDRVQKLSVEDKVRKIWRSIECPEFISNTNHFILSRL